MQFDVLVVDDEKDIRELVKDVLEENNYLIRVASSSQDVFEKINERVPNVIILDIWLQGSEIDGLGILEIVHKKYPFVQFIMISGHGNIETAVNAIKLGAYDYLEKPFSEDKLLILTKRACEINKLLLENSELKNKVVAPRTIIGSSPAIIKLKSFIEKVAPTASRVLISGQSGTGKTLFAKLLHYNSKRRNNPFIIFDAAGKSSEELESELFGETNSQSYDILSRKVGALEKANHGTIYIKGVDNLSKHVQAKILRFIQDFTIMRSNSNVKLDVRIIASANKDLKNEIAQNNFREDLYYRLNVVPIEIPPLSSRRQDIEILCNFFIEELSKIEGYQKITLHESTLAALQAYSWPGNIRQLRNVLEWLIIMVGSSSSREIIPSMLPSEILQSDHDSQITKNNNSSDLSLTLREAREQFEQEYLKKQLTRFNGNISKMSNAVGMERSALHRKLKFLGILSDEERR